jgi:hypothetical protein
LFGVLVRLWRWCALLALAACSRQPKAPPIPAPETPPAHAKEPEKPHEKEWGLDMDGQLDRISALFHDPGFEGSSAGELGMWKSKEAGVPQLREVSGISSAKVDPRAVLWIAVHADRYCEAEGGLTYPMLTKNADRSAGRPWFIMNAKIIEILEEGRTSVARVEMDPGKNPIFVQWRYLTNFVAGDRVDVVGFWAGYRTYDARAGKVTIPALAAAAVLKPGTIRAMNKVSRVWLGDVGPDQLRNYPRKI